MAITKLPLDSSVPKILSTTQAISNSDIRTHAAFAITGNSITVTIPSPVADNADKLVLFINEHANSSTLSRSSGFVGSQNTVTIPGRSAFFLLNRKQSDGKYKWATLAATTVDAGLSETIADVVGAMVGSNTETMITVTYDDVDNTLDFVVTKASAAEIDGGTEDGKVITPKGLKDSAYPSVADVQAVITGGTHVGLTAAAAGSVVNLTYTGGAPDHECSSLIGSVPGSIDSLPGASLADGQTIETIVRSDPSGPGLWYRHYIDADSAQAESSPVIIAADAGGGNKRAILADAVTSKAAVRDWQEGVEDTVGAMIGTASATLHRGITPTYGDAGGTLAFVNDGFKWVKTALTGAGGLDTIAIASLTDGDRARVVASGVVYDFYFVAAATDAEDSPRKIRPDDYATAGVWYLCTYHGSAQSYGTTPGAISTSTSGQAGTAVSASRSDHCHSLGTHTHADNTVGGAIPSTSISDFQEATEDVVGAMVATTSATYHRGISPAYTDGSGLLAFINDGFKWVKTALTGAGGLDTVAIAGISDGDRARVVASGVVYDFYFVAAATDAEDSPRKIRPDDYSAAGVWYLATIHASSLPAGITAVATAAFTPTLGWSGGAAPTVTTEVYRQKTIYDRCFWNMDISGSDGGASTTLTVDFPAALVPTDRNALVPCKAQVSVNGAAYSNVLATLDCEAAAGADRQLTVACGTLTDDQAFRIIISGDHEITPA